MAARYWSTLRCKAKTRKGTPCKAPGNGRGGQAVVRFRSIVMKPRLRIVHSEPACEVTPAMLGNAPFLDHYHCAHAVRQEIHAIAANITATFEEMRARLAQL